MSLKFNQNNLGSSASPYLRQHAANPVWWQEWSSETLAYARQKQRPILVSVGYATCHWCHVMAAGAFSDPETAAYLNASFVSIKIDREQRPDIDHYLMSYIQAQTGSGGWPLNVFMTYDLKPVHALTYAPVKTSGYRYSLHEIARAVTDLVRSRGDTIQPFRLPDQEAPRIRAQELLQGLTGHYDKEYGGFGMGQKFPPHSTLLFILYRLAAGYDLNSGRHAVAGEPPRAVAGDDSTSTLSENSSTPLLPDGAGELHLTPGEEQTLMAMATSTLDAIMLRGLNDHLQGGIYRYCVDREWTIPHFEKMLYDQALALWSYSLASRLTGNGHYRQMALMIIRSLEETFLLDGLYISAFNADTDHQEGATYLWDYDELTSLLTPDEMERFTAVYTITGEGNFEGRNHLIRGSSDPLQEIEEKLLALRRQRSQPSADTKILSGQNALLAVAMIQASRMLSLPDMEAEAARLTSRLIEQFWDGASLAHSYYEGTLQKQAFLSDGAALLLALTMLYESDHSWEVMMNTFAGYVRSFRDEDSLWIESDADDFRRIEASWFDHPLPSPVSMAEMALTRVALLTGGEVTAASFRRPYQSDFYNINVLMTMDLFRLYTTREPLPWEGIPAGAIQRRGEPESVCYHNSCRPLQAEAKGKIIE